MKGGEKAYAEDPTLAWLADLGWTVVGGHEIAPGSPGAERANWTEVVLTARLGGAIAKLNPELTPAAAALVVARVKATASPQVIRDHEDSHSLLTEGVPVTWSDTDGLERSTRARLVDFQNPANNDFLAVSQFRIILGAKHRKPDVLLFVNGIPLGQIELKDPTDAAATKEAAVRQVAHYVETIPHLYRFIEFFGVSDLLQARVGTITTPEEHFAEWRSMDPAEEEGRSQLEVMLRGAFAPAKFLDIVENFCVFQSDGDKLCKIVAKYHQVDTVRRAVEATFVAMKSHGRAGVVWHAPGSGKSLEMVFFVGILRRDARFSNPTIVAVCDETALDDQLSDVFASIPALAQSVQQAEAIGKGTASLRALLNVPAGGIVCTTIQKFQPISGETEVPLASGRQNVIVIADEAHRTQYGKMAQNITRALPNSVRIGFTGTPIEKGDRSTRLVFGDYISIYTMLRSNEDGMTVPIYYESRGVPVHVQDQELLASVDDVVEAEETRAQRKLITKWARLEVLVGAPERLDKVAGFCRSDYLARCEVLEGKAIIVGMSRRICSLLTERLQSLLGAETVTCVISAAATEEAVLSKWRRSKAELEQVKKNFRDPNHPLRVVVVRNLWLTGYDVPCLHTLYVDKPMKDHGLLQAIARVNRVFRDKPGGTVVDLIGIGTDLREALPAYTQSDVKGVAVPVESLLVQLKEKHEVLCAFFHGLRFETRKALEATAQATLLANAHARAVTDDDTTKRFLEDQAAFARLYALLSTTKKAIALAGDGEFFADVAASVRKYTPPKGLPSPGAEQAVKMFVSMGLGAGEVIDIFGVAGKDRPEISILSDQFLDSITRKIHQPELQLALLKELLNQEVRVRARQNALAAKKFSEQLDEALRRYANRQLSTAEIVERLVELCKKARVERHRHRALGLTPEELAFYDALAAQPETWTADPKLVAIVKSLVQGIRADLTVDWASHESTEAALRARIKRILRREHYEVPGNGTAIGGGLEKVAGRILDQARALYYYWPEVDDLIAIA
jgi:type I restriction enzyme R subunit